MSQYVAHLAASRIIVPPGQWSAEVSSIPVEVRPRRHEVAPRGALLVPG